MRFMGRGLIGMLLLFLTIGLLALAAGSLWQTVKDRQAGSAPPHTARERIFSVNVEPVILGEVTPVITAFGEVESRRTLDVRAAAGGALVALADEFRNGGRIDAGTLLFQTDPSGATADLNLANTALSEGEAELSDAVAARVLARADVTAAKTQLELRDRSLERQKSLNQRGVGSAAALEAAELSQSAARQTVLAKRQALAQAEARINRASSDLERRKINAEEAARRLSDTSVFAEFDGVLSDVNAVKGGLVNANERLGRLIDPSALEVAFRLSNAEFGRIVSDSGQLKDVGIRVLFAGSDITGKIDRVSAAVGEGQTGREVFARLEPENAAFLRPGDFVTVQIQEPALQQVVAVPASAVSSASKVLVVGKGDRLEEVGVTILRKQQDDVILRGPLEGREIVIERAPQLGAGIKVRPIRKQAEPRESRTESLSREERQKLVAFVQSNGRIPKDRKAQIIEQLNQPEVSTSVVERIRSRMGG